MPLVCERPVLPPDNIYNVKEVCYYLTIDPKTLKIYRDLGYIRPLNPASKRPVFTGESIMKCHDRAKIR